MFTGIVEGLGKVQEIKTERGNRHFRLTCPFQSELKVDQSLSHQGVCLTVTQVGENGYWVTAIDETLQKTNLGALQVGQRVNLERCMPAHGRFDGHVVQGHVDQTGICTSIEDRNGSWLIGFQYDTSKGNITVSKGSICVNGVSLTVVDSEEGYFSVAIIPFTWEHTSFQFLQPEMVVNLEFDIVGKYIQKILAGYLPPR